MNIAARKAIRLCSAVAVALIFCTGCSVIDGTGSSTQTGIIIGKILNEDGTPANNAQVLFIQTDQIPSPSLAKLATENDSTTTNDSGIYKVRELPAATYNIFAQKDSQFCYLNSVKIDSTVSTISPATLRKPGSLSGIVRLLPNDDSRTVLILVYGSNIFRFPSDFTGHFTLDNMAEGSYKVKILTTIAGYMPLDTTFFITAGKNDTLGDTLRLKYSGIPTVTGLLATWDSLKFMANLTWNKADTSVVKGYNVYRTVVDSALSGIPFNQALITSNSFTDSFGLDPANSYVYRIKAVNKNDDVGQVYSAADTVKPISAYHLIKSINRMLGTDTMSFEVYKGKIYIKHKQATKIEIVDTSGVSNGFFGDSGGYPLVNPIALAICSDEVYVADQEQASPISASIKKYTLSGKFLSRTPIPVGIASFVVPDTDNIYTMDSLTVRHFDKNGAIIDSVKLGNYSYTSDFGASPVMHVSKSQIAIVGAFASDTMELIYVNTDLSFAKLRSFPGLYETFFAIDAQGFICFPGIIYDNSGNLYARYPISSQSIGFEGITINVDQNSNIYVADNAGNFQVYRKN